MTELINNQFLNTSGKLVDIQVAINQYNSTRNAIDKFNKKNRLDINNYKRIRANRVYAEKGEGYEKIVANQKKYAEKFDRTAYNRQYYLKRLEKKKLEKLEEKPDN